jgi:uncharacterized membrane protein YgaE (UPF0421/DUF939 family)
MKLGARIIKTGIAVTVSLYIATLLNLNPVIFAALAAVLSVQPSLYRSWQTIIDQLQANVIGAVFAISITYLLGNEPYIIGIVVMLVIATNLQFKFEKAIPLSIITVIAIMESTTGNFLHFALDRFLLILTGIGSSLLVNAVFLPPKYQDKLYSKIHLTNRLILEYLRSSTMNEVETKIYREDSKKLKETLDNMRDLYTLYKEERTYFRKVRFSKTRKLVIFRKMIQCTQKGFKLLEHIEHQQRNLQLVPVELRELLQREVEILTNYHEKILLKFEGKIKTNHPHHTPADMMEGRGQLLQSFMQLYSVQGCSTIEFGQEQWIQLFPLIAKLIDYSEQLEQLDRLVENYHSFHVEH